MFFFSGSDPDSGFFLSDGSEQWVPFLKEIEQKIRAWKDYFQGGQIPENVYLSAKVTVKEKTKTHSTIHKCVLPRDNNSDTVFCHCPRGLQTRDPTPAIRLDYDNQSKTCVCVGSKVNTDQGGTTTRACAHEVYVEIYYYSLLFIIIQSIIIDDSVSSEYNMITAITIFSTNQINLFG